MHKIIADNIIHTTRFLNLKETVYTVNDSGTLHKWVYAERPNKTNAVFIVATVNGRLVVTNEYRVLVQGYTWGLPAGLIEGNESPESTAVRELKEECGLDVVKFIRPKSPLLYSSPGLSNEGSYFVYVEAIGDLKPNLQDNEDIVTYLMGQKQVSELITDNPDVVFDAKAYHVFNMFARFGEV